MKITKLLPLALSLMLFSPAFAADATTESNLSIDVADFIKITKGATAVETTSTSPDSNYQNLTLSAAMKVPFEIINNKIDRMLYLTGSAAVDGSTVNALYSTNAADGDKSLRLVFTNEDHKPAAASVENITTNTAVAVASNPDAFAVPITAVSENFGKDATTGATNPTIAFTDTKGVSYKISNGVFKPEYTFGTANEGSTFSTHDTNGTYKATLKLSTVAF